MPIVTGILAFIVLIGLLVMQFGGAVGALFFGRKLPWVWFALAVLEVTRKILSVALYRETDTLRGIGSLAGGLLAVVLALLLQKRFRGVVLALGGFLASGVVAVQALGPLLNPAPEWVVLALLAMCGIAGATWASANRGDAIIILSALVGAGVLTDTLIGPLGVDEAHRFQVYAILALAGIGFQFWRERRRPTSAPPQPQGAAS